MNLGGKSRRGTIKENYEYVSKSNAGLLNNTMTITGSNLYKLIKRN